MSFVHNVRVGFYGAAADASSARELQLEECAKLMTDFAKSASAELQVQADASPRGDVTRGYILGYASGHPIVLKAGMLVCPYVSTSFILGSIAFVASVHLSLGCPIYSDDEGRFLSLREFIPENKFSEVMKEVARSMGQPYER